MDPDRWRRVKAIFDAAVEESHDAARAALLDRECAGDAGLRQEVETLLESHGRAESFLETPAAGLQTAGMLLGAYRLLERTGEGGSAEVFRAERADGHFHKQVAVKVLRAGIYGDDARRRFRRERQVLAELDHPNIVRLWDGGIAPDGRPYLVEDYLEGQPITVLAGRQGLDRAARVRLLLPVCDALAYAHTRGVVHRDLKPGNILTTADGTPKLVDFGIAGFGVPGGDAQTLTQTRFWTPEYASPEQARGEIPGRGSDIYSICVVLYELLLDRQPYQVRDLGLIETVQTICEREPDFSGLDKRLRAILRKGLAKDAAVRYEDAGALAADLRSYLEGSVTHAEQAPPPSGRRVWRWLAVGGVAAAFAFGAWWLTNSAEPRLDILQIPGRQSEPSVSPDGSRLVFSWTDQETAGLGIAGVDGRNPRWLTRNRADCCAKWSPDGRWIAFGRKTEPDRRDVILVAPDGGQERVIARMEGAHLSWTKDSKQLSIVRKAHPEEPLAIFLVDVDTGRQQRLSGPALGDWGDIAAAEAGPPFGWVLARYVSRGNGRLWIQSMSQLRPLTSEPTWVTSPVANAEGTEVYFRADMQAGGGVWRVPADASSPPKLIPMLKGWFSEPSISRSSGVSGLVLAASYAPWNVNVWQMRLPPESGAPEPLLNSTASEETPTLSADGSSVAFRHDINGATEFWQAAADGSRARVVVRPGAKESRSPRYSPDGKLLAFVSHQPEARVYVADVSSGRFQRLTQSEREENLPDWSPDGRWIYFRSAQSGRPEIWRASATGGQLRQITTGGGVAARLSHDGRTLFVVKSADVSPVFAMPADGGPLVELRNAPRVQPELWEVGGDAIWWFDRDHEQGTALKRYRLSSAATELVSVLPGRPRVIPGISLAKDGSRILWTQQDHQESRIAIVHNFR